MNRKKLGLSLLGVLVVLGLGGLGYHFWFSATEILIVNPLASQAADIALNNNSKHIHVTTMAMEDLKDLSDYDAVIFYGRGLFLDEDQMAEVERVAAKGVPIFTNATRQHSSFLITRNLNEEQNAQLTSYFQNGNRQNYRNGLRYLRHIATPGRWGDQDYEDPVEMPHNMFYHREYGQYFKKAEDLTAYLQKKRLYHKDGKTIALISGITFPAEGNRAHVDTLITTLTQEGYNVYPLTAVAKARQQMLRKLKPDAIIFFPMGKIGNDTLVNWIHEKSIALFTPFPATQSHEEWIDANKPISGGSLSARIVIPEVDGGMAPYCIATQNENKEGFYRYTVEGEQLKAFLDFFNSYMQLRDLPNAQKKVAICYFKTPGKDALLASGMEVVPSMYNFLNRLRDEGYNVNGLPATVQEFEKQIYRDGAVMGSYAKGAQEAFLKTAHPVWLTSQQYETWAHQVLTPGKYKEVTDRYGAAPGNLLATSDSIAVACLQFGNVLLFPQPRPALGDDEFKLVHGAQVAPPHSYLAPYLYMQKGFKANVLIHFGTHGNLEYTPGKNVGLSYTDWAEALTAHLPHFYYYTTGNVGEGIIAKRRTHATLVTYLTPPYVESGMRQQYASVLEDIHKAIDEGDSMNQALGLRIKQEVVRIGLHRNLNLDSILTRPYSLPELEKLDAFTEEIANEKTIGAYYTLGEPYSQRDLQTTTLAIAADPLAYEMAKQDRDKKKITTTQLQDGTFIIHHYLQEAKQRIQSLFTHMPKDTTGIQADLRPAVYYYNQLLNSTRQEMDVMLRALNGGNVFPAPGGDPVLNPNVLPTGRNMYSVNAEMAPNARAWEDGMKLADATLAQYVSKHGDYPRKVSYTFWAGEFITTEGATLAQAFWMLGVEPVRDKEGHIVDLKVVPEDQLKRPRVNVVIQISGQLRDIAGSCLKSLTQAIKLASEAPSKKYPNYVAQGSKEQEKQLLKNGMSAQQARDMSVMRIFGPVNSGYSTGMLGLVESSGSWDDRKELTEGFLNNMGAIYGDEEHWGAFLQGLFSVALTQTDVIIQPRQSNTWGPISLDHVYEFTGGISNAIKTITGKEPDAYMADYRNRSNRRMQETQEAIAVETRATILNPTYVKERMKGGAGTAQMFGEIFRNIFGWESTRPSAMDKEIFNDLYRMYMTDENNLGIYEYFNKTNPASFQAMTSVMLESARKGFWKPSKEQLQTVAKLHAQMTKEQGAACTEFVCGNTKLQKYISSQLSGNIKKEFDQTMDAVYQSGKGSQKDQVLKQENKRQGTLDSITSTSAIPYIIGFVVVLIVVLGWVSKHKNRKR